MEQINTHDRMAVITAIISFVIGWGLTVAGFLVPPKGEVHSSILAILGEAMIYAASVFGVTLYFKGQMEKFRRDTRQFLADRDRQPEYSGSDSDGVGEEEEN